MLCREAPVPERGKGWGTMTAPRPRQGVPADRESDTRPIPEQMLDDLQRTLLEVEQFISERFAAGESRSPVAPASEMQTRRICDSGRTQRRGLGTPHCSPWRPRRQGHLQRFQDAMRGVGSRREQAGLDAVVS